MVGRRPLLYHEVVVGWLFGCLLPDNAVLVAVAAVVVAIAVAPAVVVLAAAAVPVVVPLARLGSISAGESRRIGSHFCTT